MSTVPVMDQGQFGICFAYAATQWADAYRSRHSGSKPEFISSPVALSVEMAAKSWRMRFFRNPVEEGGGLICDALDALRKRGACDHRKLAQNELANWMLQHDLKDAMGYFKRFHAADWELIELSDNPEAIPEKVAAARKKREAALAGVCRVAQQQPDLPANLRDSVSAIVKELNDKNSMEFLQSLRLNSCQKPENRAKADIPRCKEDWSFFDQQRNLKELHHRLSQADPLPVPISYCSSLLERGRGFKLRRSKFWMRILGVDSEECGAHASLVIGRRMKTRDDGSQKCQFLVRNSWGTGCWNYSDDWDCENGNVWVDAEVLSRSIFGITRFKGDE